MRRLLKLSLILCLLLLSACRGTTVPNHPAPPPGDPAPAPASPAAQNPRVDAQKPLSAPTSLPPTLPPPTSPPPTPPPSPTVPPTATRPPAPTLPPTPSPTPAPTLRRLTTDGCCIAPWWRDDRHVMFLDKPTDAAPSGYYALDVDKVGSKPELYQERVASWTSDFKYVITRENGSTLIERPEDGQKWRIRTGNCSLSPPTGCNVSLSPDRRFVLWSITLSATGPFESRPTQVWIANIDGSDARLITTVYRGGASWFPDGRRLLLQGRPNLATQEIALATLDLATGARTELVRGERVSRGGISPDGNWLVYTVALHRDESQTGIFMVRTDGSDRRKLPFFGPAAWRGDNRLIFIPLEESAEHHTFYEYDTAADTVRPLTDPMTTPFKIAFGDWSLSPDGRRIVFVSARDRNLWLLELPAKP